MKTKFVPDYSVITLRLSVGLLFSSLKGCTRRFGLLWICLAKIIACSLGIARVCIIMFNRHASMFASTVLLSVTCFSVCPNSGSPF